MSIELKKVSDRISFLPASVDPLSCDVGIIKGDNCTWIYDAGFNDDAAELINSIEGPKKLILSHFHMDHTGNVNRVFVDKIYGGNYTCKKMRAYLGREKGPWNVENEETAKRLAAVNPDVEVIAVDSEFEIEDGVKLKMFNIPSSHSKGCLGLLVDDQYAFIGDAAYPLEKFGDAVYNASIINQTINTLESLPADRLLASHRKGFVMHKRAILKMLTTVLKNRVNGEPYIKGV